MKSATEKLNLSVDRSLTILEFIVTQEKGFSLAKICEHLSIPKSTAYRILETLNERGYIKWNDSTEKYSVGLKLIELGIIGLSNNEIVEVTAPHLRHLSEMTGETCFLGVLNEGEVVYLYKIEGTNSIRTSAQLGERRLAHCTGLGKAMLSTLSMEEIEEIAYEKRLKKLTKNTITDLNLLHKELIEIRKVGYSFDNEENELGVSCLSVPLYNFTGSTVGAISCAGPTKQIRKNKDVIVKEISESGQYISRLLGFTPSNRLHHNIYNNS